MESLYARDTPTAHERKLKLGERDHVMPSRDVVQDRSKNKPQLPETFDCLMNTSTESSDTIANAGAIPTVNSSTNSTDDTFGFPFASLPRTRLQQSLGKEWQTIQRTSQLNQEKSRDSKKTEEGRLAELSEETISLGLSLPALKTEKLETRTVDNPQQKTTVTAVSDTTLQSRRAGATSIHRRSKPAITINTGSDLTGVCAKRSSSATPASPPTFSWNDILCVQNLIERCLQQYLSKVNAVSGFFNDILIILKEQANVDPAFANVVWQKLEEQNPMFFRAYSLQLQLKEQIIAFNDLVGQQKEMTATNSKCVLQYSNLNRSSASRASGQCSLITAPTSTALPPRSKDARPLLRTPLCSVRQQHQHTNMYQLTCSSKGLGATSSSLTTLPLSSPLPLPSPIKTDLDTHAFFT
ncbi:hypothetical protein DD238_001089 [Peronospora effusa]|uniref:Uncharacterized protein n=1 Tax=Peronospora effusa TaxID=542832 RepID=A0A3M6VK00_9STRA|nr:hypothetical protein DD238_001089 [Peronospora effusa]